MNHFLDVVARGCLQLGLLILLYAALGVVGFVLIFTSIHPGFLVLFLGFLVVLCRRRRRSSLEDGTAFGTARWCSFEHADAAGKFQPQGLFLGRFAGPIEPIGRWRAIKRLFSLPRNDSAKAVREFFPEKR